MSLEKALLHARLHQGAEREKHERENQLSRPGTVDDAKHRQVTKQSRNQVPPSRRTLFAARTSRLTSAEVKCASENLGSLRVPFASFAKRRDFEALCLAIQRSQKRHSHAIEMHAVNTSREANGKFVWLLVNGAPLKFKAHFRAEVPVVPSTYPGVPLRLDKPEGHLTGQETIH